MEDTSPLDFEVGVGEWKALWGKVPLLSFFFLSSFPT